MKKHQWNIADICVIILSAVAVIGSLTFFKTKCGESMSGMAGMESSLPACHHANTVITICAAVLLALSVIVMFLKKPMKGILSAVISFGGVVTALIPGVIMPICKMESMSCVSTMKPWTMLLGILIAVIACINAVVQFAKKG